MDSTIIDANTANNVENRNDRSKQLRQHLKQIIESETEATEERIEQYTKQQMALLKSFRERAQQDYIDILR